MCDPVTLAITATVVSSLGSISTASAQYETGKYNEAVANENSRLAEQDAIAAEQTGVIEENKYRRTIKQLQGKQVTAIAANNLEQSGSALDILSDTAAVGELDALTIRNNAAREAFGFRVQSASQKAKGKLDRFKGSTQATGTILGGIGDSLSLLPS